MPKVLDEEVLNVVCRCGGDAIDSLLRDAKAAGKPVKLSAKNKEELVRENLRRAVADRHISVDRVFSMIAEWEENRGQYHLFFTAKKDVAQRMINSAGISSALWGANWQSEKDFPRVLDEPVGVVPADFRELDDGWIAKWYRGGKRWVLDDSESETTEDRKVRVWEKQYQREVWCARYYSKVNILDMRIPNLDNRDDIAEAQRGVWGAFERAVAPTEVQPFGLQEAAARIAQDASGLGGRVSVSYSRFPGSKGGNATYSAHGDQEPLHNNTEFVTACQFFTVANEIVVHWLKTTSSDVIGERTRTVIGSKGPNSLLFSAESTRKCVEHVIAEIVQLQLAQ